MTTLTATAQSASLPTGEHSSPASSKGQLLRAEFSVVRPLPIENTVSLDSLLSEFESDPEMAALMTQERRNLGATMYADEPETFSALRLAAGLSQAKLAELSHTSQPHIARIEGGITDPGTDVIAKIANALGVNDQVAFKAIRAQRASRGNAHE